MTDASIKHEQLERQLLEGRKNNSLTAEMEEAIEYELEVLETV